MKIESVIAGFESENAKAITEATWQILRCNDKDAVSRLVKYLPQFKQILSQVELSGLFIKHETYTKLAFLYIENCADGICRCRLYQNAFFLSPRYEERYGFVDVIQAKVHKGLYETHFDVICLWCEKAFLVREIQGWHLPVYEWVNWEQR